MPVTQHTSLDDLFLQAKATVVELNPDEEFITKDLFRGFEWNRIPKNLRTKLGMLFFYYSSNDGSDIIKPLGKTPQNQQRYKRINSTN